MLEFLAQTTLPGAPTTGSAATGLSQYLSYVPILAFVVLLYFMMIAPKRKQDKQRQELINSIKKGDRIQTIGGILGTVVNVDANEVVVKVDESSNTKMRFTRSAIHRVVADTPAVK